MKIVPEEFYGKNYHEPTRYMDAYGQERTYDPPARDWTGFSDISNFLKNNFPGVQTIHDIGCGAGSFVARASSFGFNCTGEDINRHDVKNCMPGARGKLKFSNITERERPITQAEMVICFDLFEHIYESDIDTALRYIIESIRPGGCLFACICVARNPGEVWSHSSPDVDIPVEMIGLGISGHVTLKTTDYWIRKLESFGLTTMYDMMARFQIWKECGSPLEGMMAWSIKNVFFWRKS